MSDLDNINSSFEQKIKSLKSKEAPKTKFLVKKPPTDAVKFKLEEE